MGMLRKSDKATGRASRDQGSRAQGENAREAWRQRQINEVTAAINKGHRNEAIFKFLKGG